MVKFFNTIYEQMGIGNFSFAILMVGIIQCVLMLVTINQRKK